MTLIHNYIYKEIILLTCAIIGVLTFLLVATNMVRVVESIMYTDLPMWMTLKIMVLFIPLTLTFTIPAGLLAAVLIVFGRMSSDRELLALKASGIGLLPIVAPVIFIATALSAVDFVLLAYVVPECQQESSNMRHDILTNNPLDLFTPEVVGDKIPGLRIYFSRKEGHDLYDVVLWKIDEPTNKLTAYMQAQRATINLDLEHTQLVMILSNESGKEYPPDGDPLKVHPGEGGAQVPLTFSLNSFYEKAQRRLSWLTLPEIEDILFAMQSAPSGEPASPYLTELSARISYSIAAFTFVIVGIPLAIQTQRRETIWGVVFTLLIVGLYFFLIQSGKALKTYADLYPEIIIWTPNFLFEAVGFYLFYHVNRK